MKAVRRLLDVTVAGIALLTLSPVLAGIAAAIRLRMGSPVLFRQKRPGLHGRIFRLYKFRTMREARSVDGAPLPDVDRITPLGRFLRAWSLDELPELFNVVKGDMSLVGPRPLRVEYLPLYTPDQARRHDVRPGITGWAQINGRNAVSWETKFHYDVWYVDNQSLALDLRILARTVLKVLRGEGISAPDHATMPPFTGTRAGPGDAHRPEASR